MPRTRPDRTEEVRISLSNKERQFFAEQLQINRNKAWLGPLIGNIGTVTIGTGLVIGGYALWKWVGGFSPKETIVDWMEDSVQWIGGGVYKTIYGEDIETTVNRWQDVYNNKIDEINLKCTERKRLPEAIISNPNSSENQVSQAQREVEQIQISCDKQRAKVNQEHYESFKKKMDELQKASNYNPLLGPLPQLWIAARDYLGDTPPPKPVRTK